MSAKQSACSLLANIPWELLDVTFEYLYPRERILLVERTCRRWASLSHKGAGWNRFSTNDLGGALGFDFSTRRSAYKVLGRMGPRLHRSSILEVGASTFEMLYASKILLRGIDYTGIFCAGAAIARHAAPFLPALFGTLPHLSRLCIQIESIRRCGSFIPLHAVSHTLGIISKNVCTDHALLSSFLSGIRASTLLLQGGIRASSLALLPTHLTTLSLSRIHSSEAFPTPLPLHHLQSLESLNLTDMSLSQLPVLPRLRSLHLESVRWIARSDEKENACPFTTLEHLSCEEVTPFNLYGTYMTALIVANPSLFSVCLYDWKPSWVLPLQCDTHPKLRILLVGRDKHEPGRCLYVAGLSPLLSQLEKLGMIGWFEDRDVEDMFISLREPSMSKTSSRGSASTLAEFVLLRSSTEKQGVLDVLRRVRLPHLRSLYLDMGGDKVILSGPRAAEFVKAESPEDALSLITDDAS